MGTKTIWEKISLHNVDVTGLDVLGNHMLSVPNMKSIIVEPLTNADIQSGTMSSCEPTHEAMLFMKAGGPNLPKTVVKALKEGKRQFTWTTDT